jgi:hypothetical protein
MVGTAAREERLLPPTPECAKGMSRGATAGTVVIAAIAAIAATDSSATDGGIVAIVAAVVVEEEAAAALVVEAVAVAVAGRMQAAVSLSIKRRRTRPSCSLPSVTHRVGSIRPVTAAS